MVVDIVYAIVVYDVCVSRVNKIRKILGEYLSWTQNSVFRGEITRSKLMALKRRIGAAIDKSQDSVMIFSVREKALLKEEVIGIEKALSPDELEVI